MKMGNEINPLYIVKGDATIFDDPFIIPIYQRPYGWKEEEIIQLIDDIANSGNSYCLGSFITIKNGESREVIDGQQRLTTLFLLLTYLGYHLPSSNLKFECREKSNDTLAKFKDVLEGKIDCDVDEDIIEGYRIIATKCSEKGFDAVKFKERLSSTYIFPIEMPEYTDRNKYFEIMNTRGEQLESTDILKARLMGAINDEGNRNAFSKIWDACRRMYGYLIMHFDGHDRRTLFGNCWDKTPAPEDIKKLGNGAKATSGLTAIEIIGQDGQTPKEETSSEDNDSRFEGFISFEHFLLHALYVYDGGSSVSFTKSLIENFEEAGGKEFTEKFSLEFIECLLKCRLLFDKYFLKREIDDKEGKIWSLKELLARAQISKSATKVAQYNNTCFKHKGEEGEPPLYERIKMLEECLRVTYTSPLSMSWVSKALSWLYRAESFDDMQKFEEVLEKNLKDAVKEHLKNGDQNRGTSTPHVIFNYLDYLLWKKDSSVKFDFKFSNSVEHWYPQHPEEGEKWDKVDRFGNLCLISREINSRFSNLSPFKKKTAYEATIAKSSLKLRLMSEATKKDEGWKGAPSKKHEEEMIKLLEDAYK